MATIVLCRIDSRLVHGQVVTKWVNQSQANRIVIISDELMKDPFLLSIYEMSAPPGMKISCYGEKELTSNMSVLDEGKILMLFPDVSSLKRVFDDGLVLDEVQIGGLGGGPSRKVVYQNITLDQNDFESLLEMQSKGLKIYFQTIPEDRAVGFDEVMKKF